MVVEVRAPARDPHAESGRAISRFHYDLHPHFEPLTSWKGQSEMRARACRDAFQTLDSEAWVAVAAELALPSSVNDRVAILAARLDGRFGDVALGAVYAYRRNGKAARFALGVDWRNCASEESSIFKHPKIGDKLDRFGNFVSIPPLSQPITHGYLRQDADGQLKAFLQQVLAMNPSEINKRIKQESVFSSIDPLKSLSLSEFTPEERALLEKVEACLVDEQKEFKTEATTGTVHHKDPAPPSVQDQLVSRLAVLAGIGEDRQVDRLTSHFTERRGQPGVFTKRKNRKDQELPKKDTSSADEDARVRQRRQERALLADKNTEAQSLESLPQPNNSDSTTPQEVRIWKKREAQRARDEQQPNIQPALKGPALRRALAAETLNRKLKTFERENNKKDYTK